MLLARDDLTPETALDIAYPSAANTDLSFDVTAAVQAWVNAGAAKAGLLLAPVYSEIGYEDWISVGGCGYAAPPRLIVVHEGAVADESTVLVGPQGQLPLSANGSAGPRREVHVRGVRALPPWQAARNRPSRSVRSSRRWA